MIFLLNAVVAEDQCVTCLKAGKVWCYNVLTRSGACVPQSDIASCKVYENHDLVFNASSCCLDSTTAAKCIEGEQVNYCGWCGLSGVNLCLYKDQTLVSKVCPGPVNDLGSCDGLLNQTVCSGKAPQCEWNAKIQQCQVWKKEATFASFQCPQKLVKNTEQSACECAGGEKYYNAAIPLCFNGCTNSAVLNGDSFGYTSCDCSGTLIDGTLCITCGPQQEVDILKKACVCPSGYRILGTSCEQCKADQISQNGACLCAKGKANDDGTCKKMNALAIGLIAGGAAVVIVGAAVLLVFCLRRKQCKKHTGPSSKEIPLRSTALGAQQFVLSPPPAAVTPAPFYPQPVFSPPPKEAIAIQAPKMETKSLPEEKPKTQAPKAAGEAESAVQKKTPQEPKKASSKESKAPEKPAAKSTAAKADAKAPAKSAKKSK